MPSDEDLDRLLDRVPLGWSEVDYGGSRWSLSRTDHAGGRSLSIYAENLGGPGVVSANVYRTAAGDLLRPCEMPAKDVLDFLTGWRQAGPADAS